MEIILPAHRAREADDGLGDALKIQVLNSFLHIMMEVFQVKTKQ
jgi:hypothetical protein